MTRNVPEQLYREFFSRNPNSYVFPEEPNMNLVQFVEQFKDEKKEMTAIDLGCGEGRSSIFLAKVGFDVAAVDLSPTIIKKAKERFGRQNHVDYCVAEITSMPIRSEAFDLAIDITTLNNQKSRKRQAYFREIGRCLKIGGSYYVSVVSIKDPTCRNNCPKRHFTLRKSGSYRQFYSIGIVKKLISKYLYIVSLLERKDGVSNLDEFESIEVIAKRIH